MTNGAVKVAGSHMYVILEGNVRWHVGIVIDRRLRHWTVPNNTVKRLDIK